MTSNSKKTITPSQFPIDPHKNLDLFAELIGDQLLLIRRDGRIAYANKAAVRGFGYPAKILLNKKITDFLNRRVSVAHWRMKYFEPVKRKRTPMTFQVEQVVKNGEIRYIEVTAVFLEYHREEYLLAIGRDITEKIRMQQDLRESEDLYRLLSEGAADGIFIADREGKIQYSNKFLETLVGVPLSQAAGRHFRGFLAPGSLPRAMAAFETVLNKQIPVREEMDLISKRGDVIPVEVNGSPLYKNGQLIGVHAIIRDIRKRRELERLNREAERMAAVNDFISGTAKEIKYPLETILAQTKNLLQHYQHREFEYIGYKEFKTIMHSIDSIDRQVKACWKTTNRLLAISQKKSGLKTASSNINGLMKEILQIYAEQFNGSVHVKLQLGNSLPDVAIGSIELDHVITNILNNALESMPAGGRIFLKTYYLRGTQQVCLECRDEGVGIPKENLERIFRPFFTTKHTGSHKGAGLGLMIVRSILQAHGGDIQIESSLRRGTVVKIFLPVHRKK